MPADREEERDPRESLRGIRREMRSVFVRLRLVDIRRATRKTLDLFRFGEGAGYRILGALVFAALFFLTILFASRLAHTPAVYGLSLAAASAVVVMATSATLVLWGTDEAIEATRAPAAERLAELREEAAALREEVEAVEAHEAERRAEREGRRRDAAEAEESRQEEWRARFRRCPYCREVIRRNAVKCRHCGEILDDDLREERAVRVPRRYSAGLAALFSFFLPGLGQLYKGQFMGCLGWWFLVGLGYGCFFFPGVVLHLICMMDAASGEVY